MPTNAASTHTRHRSRLYAIACCALPAAAPAPLNQMGLARIFERMRRFLWDSTRNTTWCLFLCGIFTVLQSLPQDSTTNTRQHVLISPHLLRVHTFNDLYQRLLPWEWNSIRTREVTISGDGVTSPTMECPADFKPGFGSCCLHSYGTNGRDDRPHCYADLVTNYRLLPPASPEKGRGDGYKTMLDVMTLLEVAKQKRRESQRESPEIRWQLIGDSIHLQFLNGLQCGFYRHGLRSENTVIQDWSKQRTPGMKGEWLYGPRTNVTFQVFRNHTESASQTVRGNVLPSQSVPSSHRFTATRMYRTPRTPSHYPSQLQPLLDDSDIILLNFGLHWRWKEIVSYREHMTNLLTVIRDHSRSHPEKIIIWRESSAQHHIALGGEFSIAYVTETVFSVPPMYSSTVGDKMTISQQNGGINVKSSPSLYPPLTPKEYKKLFVKCSDHRTMELNPFNETLFIRKWREIIIEEVAKEIGLTLIPFEKVLQGEIKDNGNRGGNKKVSPRMFILPFYDYTERYANMHPYKPNRENTIETEYWRDPVTNITHTYRTCDPTHFCYSPLFWEPVIDALVEIVDYAISTV